MKYRIQIIQYTCENSVPTGPFPIHTELHRYSVLKNIWKVQSRSLIRETSVPTKPRILDRAVPMKVPGYSACNPNKILIGRYCIIDHNSFEIESLSQFCHIYWPSILKYYIFVCKENFPFFLYVQFHVTAGTWYYLSLPVPVQIGAVSTCTGTKIGRPGLYDGCIYANTSILSVQLRILILLIDEHRGTDWVIDRCYP